MSNFAVDKDGNRIKTDILTGGYLRLEIEEIYKMVIPSEIKQLCFDYWLIPYCDQWDIELCKHESLEFDGQIVRVTQDNWRTIYGCHSISVGRFEWMLNIKNIIDRGIFVGIIDDSQLNHHRESAGYSLSGHGVAWQSAGGELFMKSISGEFPKVTNAYSDGIENMTMKIGIDLDERCVFFAFNGGEYIEFKDSMEFMENNSFRLAVTCGNLESGILEVELL